MQQVILNMKQSSLLGTIVRQFAKLVTLNLRPLSEYGPYVQ
jgi:hypothetical protein